MSNRRSLVNSDSLARLTERQAEVLARLAQRRTLKQIAAELCIAEATVNHHVRVLKNQFNANSLPELAEIYHAETSNKRDLTYRKPVTRKPPVPPIEPAALVTDPNGVGPVLRFHDSLSYAAPAPWDRNGPAVVPGLLNGANSKWVRAMAIVAITIGLLVAVVVGLGAIEGVSTALRGGRDAPALQ